MSGNSAAITMTLLSDAAADGEPVKCQFPGRYALLACGEFDGATAGLKVKGPDGTSWIDIEDEAGPIALTAAKSMAILLPAGEFKATISTAGVDTAVYMTLDRVTD